MVAEALGLPKLQVIETGGDGYASEPQQWDSPNNVDSDSPALLRDLDVRCPFRVAAEGFSGPE